MHYNSPIVVVDDDPEDKELIQEVCRSLRITNELIFFDDGKDALAFLRSTATQPFLILCDVNMPFMNGLELRMIIEQDENLRKKSIPFVFLSTSASQREVNAAFNLTVQGYFEKGTEYEKLKERIDIIFKYWKECRHPNTTSSVL